VLLVGPAAASLQVLQVGAAAASLQVLQVGAAAAGWSTSFNKRSR